MTETSITNPIPYQEIDTLVKGVLQSPCYWILVFNQKNANFIFNNYISIIQMAAGLMAALLQMLVIDDTDQQEFEIDLMQLMVKYADRQRKQALN